MRGEVVDSLAQQRDLHFGRSGVFGMNPVLLDYTGLGFHQLILPLKRRAPALCSSPLQLENASTEPVARKGILPLLRWRAPALLPVSNQRQEFVSRLLVLAEHAQHRTGHRLGVLLFRSEER